MGWVGWGGDEWVWGALVVRREVRLSAKQPCGHPYMTAQLECSSGLPVSPLPGWLQGGAEAGKQVHIMSSGLKAAATWHRVRILQDCRECCGGEARLPGPHGCRPCPRAWLLHRSA